MAIRNSYNVFNIQRPVTKSSISKIHLFLGKELDENPNRTILNYSSVPLFTLSMLSREARKVYRVPSSAELGTRAIDQVRPTWQPFKETAFRAISAVAVGGTLMLSLDNRQVRGDHTGAMHAAKVRPTQLSREFSFSPRIAIARYDEDILSVMDALYEDESKIASALQENPLKLVFGAAKAVSAQSRHDQISLHHVFASRRDAVIQ